MRHSSAQTRFDCPVGPRTVTIGSLLAVIVQFSEYTWKDFPRGGDDDLLARLAIIAFIMLSLIQLANPY